MRSSEIVRVAARALAIYLFFWAVSDLISIPRDVFHIHYYLSSLDSASMTATPLSFDRYYLRVYTLELTEHVLRIALWITAALWLYRGSKRVASLLGVPAAEQVELE